MRKSYGKARVARGCAAGALALALALAGAQAAPAVAEEPIEVAAESADVQAGGTGEVVGLQAEQLVAQDTSSVTDPTWSGTYNVKGEIEHSYRVVCLDDVTLVLEAGCKLTVPRGITVPEGKTLTIQGSGELVAGVSGTIGDYCAGIGGGSATAGGTVSISGSATVTATGGAYGAGIGGGGANGASAGAGGNVSISGSATVTATGGAYAAGIGGGGAYGASAGAGGNVSISGSANVTATGGDYAAGIGGGYSVNGVGAGGNVSISGSAIVKATGGTQGVGIGAGHKDADDHGTLAIGSGRFLYGSASDISTDVNDEGCFRSGAVSPYKGTRYRYMVVNGNKIAAPALSYAATSVTKTVGDAAFTNELTNPSKVDVAYESSDENVATVDENGEVTVKGAGTATITATYAGDDTHASASASYELTVKKAEAPELSYATASVTKSVGDAAFTNELTNPSKVGVAYESSDENVATVDENGKVTVKAAGTATITASFAGDDTREAASASYVLTVKATSAPTLSCLAHVRNVGDVTASSGVGSIVGTTGRALRMEGMSLSLPEGTGGSVRYMVHTQNGGWSQGWVADGAYAGTRGEARRVEAIRIELAGGLEDDYDVWYRVHAQDYGWMGWAKNGAGAGTTGQGRRVEAYEVVVLPEGSDAPGDGAFEGMTGDEGDAPALSCLAHVANRGDVTATSGASAVVGTTGQARRLEGMSLTLPEGTEGSVRYMVHTQNGGWSQGWVADGAYAGTRGEARRVEAIRVELADGLEDDYDVWYRVHAQNLGWMGWAKNGEGAGTTGQGRRIEAYEVVILPAGCPAPGPTATPFKGEL